MPEQLVAVTNPEPSNRPLVVSGTLTPSGTQNVAITGQPVSVTGGPVTQYSVQNPAIDGVYIFSAAQLPGVVAANNFLTIYNPVGSTKIVSIGGAFISMVAAAATAATAPMRGYRFSGAPTGGSVQGAATIAKFNNAYPNASAEIRIGNPTATLGPALWNTPPAVTTGAGGGQFIHSVEVPPGVGPFSLAEGEGLVLNTQAGDTDQVWNISIAWAEI